MAEQKFFICRHCGNLVGMIHDSGVPMICCGEKMQLLKANTVDASHEKHLPVVNGSGFNLNVKVGSVEHPMTAEHYIMWVYVQTENGGIRHSFKPGDKPEWDFCLGEKPIAVFAYCNLHGLWKTEI